MKSFLPLLLIIALIGCKQENKSNSSVSAPVPNILLPDILQVEYMVFFDTSSGDSWQKSLNAENFINEFRKNVYSGDIAVYSPFYSDTNQARIPLNNIEVDLGKLIDEKSLKWGNYITSSLGFIEEWNFDTSGFQFSKNVRWWYPGFFSTSDSSYHRMFHVFNQNASEILAENIIYEINFSENRSDFRYLDYKRFFSWLVNSALNKKIHVFAPDNPNSEFRPEEIKSRLGEQLVNVSDQDNSGNIVTSTAIQKFNIEELTGIIFIEDWYFDINTGSISKKVLGFAPVRHYEDENGNMLKSIPFVYYTGTKKCSIL